MPSAPSDTNRDVTTTNGAAHSSGRRWRRLRNNTETSERKQKVAKTFHGLESHVEYQEVMKTEINVACSLVASGLSITYIALQMVDTLIKRDVDVSKTTCKTHIKLAVDNDGIAVSPPKKRLVVLCHRALRRRSRQQ